MKLLKAFGIAVLVYILVLLLIGGVDIVVDYMVSNLSRQANDYICLGFFFVSLITAIIYNAPKPPKD